MSLLDNAKKEAGVEATATPVAAVETKKKHSNSEYQKKQRELSRQFGAVLKEHFNGKYPNDKVKEAVEFFAKERKAGGSTQFGTPVIYKLFGNTPKVGDKISGLKVYEDTGKGFAEMRQLMKKWAAQGIVVEFDAASKSYVIKSGEIAPLNA